MRTTSDGVEAGASSPRHPGTARPIWTEKLLSILFLALPLMALASAGPFRIETERDGGKVRSTAHVAWGGKEILLQARDGEVATRGVLMEAPGSATAAVLWLEGTSGRQGRVAVYSLSGAKLLTQTDWYERPALDKWGTSGFEVSTPLHRLELAPPWLRLHRRFQVDGATVTAAGNSKPKPATPDQTLEWANDELEAGDVSAAMEKLEAYRKELGVEQHDQPGLATCLQLLARGQIKLGRGQELMGTLGRLSADYAEEPAGQWAREALSTIARGGLQSYLDRESK